MASKIFVSYKHGDNNVYPLNDNASLSNMDISFAVEILKAAQGNSFSSFSEGFFPKSPSLSLAGLSRFGAYPPSDFSSLASQGISNPLQKLSASSLLQAFLGHPPTTARDYVEYLRVLFKFVEIYKGEGNEDLSAFKDETIKTHLKDKIYDSSVTLVLISPNMKEMGKRERDQWIPWELSYSLKKISRDGRTSQPNAILAVVLPDRNNSYDYFIVDNACCGSLTLKTHTLFSILRSNMHNIKEPRYRQGCSVHNRIHTGEPSYILSVKWCDFIADKDKYLTRAMQIRDSIEFYNITKELPDD